MNKYEQLSFERKQLQKNNEAPEWMSTAGYQLLKGKGYLCYGEKPLHMYKRIAKRAGELMNVPVPSDVRSAYNNDDWEHIFFTSMWEGWLSPSSTVLSNMGTDRGHPVSCSGSTVKDKIVSFFDTRKEMAVLTKNGYGVSTCLDPISPRGTKISHGGVSKGSMLYAEGVVKDMKEISQGGIRDGSCGIYMNILHQDFDEIKDQIMADDFGWNIGWNITKEFDELVEKDFEEANRRWKNVLKTKMVKGKGYLFFHEKVNKANPQCYKDKGFEVKHSNLCSEITLYNDDKHSFICTLSSINISKYNEWKEFPLFKVGSAFLDAVTEDMIIKSKDDKELSRVYNFAVKSRAIGLGVLGLSTYYQQNMWVFGSMESMNFNNYIFGRMDDETLVMSKYLAKHLGEPEWLEGYGERWTHRIALPPTMSTSLILGGVSQGIEPVYCNVFEQDTAGGMVYRINPVLLKLMKERGVYNEQIMERIANNQGSVFEEDWLTDDEKEVFRTAFEINQEIILIMASQRQAKIDKTGGGQSQSLNFYFPKDVIEEYVSKIHWKAYKDPNIKSLYYVRTLNEEQTISVPQQNCVVCEG